MRKKVIFPLIFVVTIIIFSLFYSNTNGNVLLRSESPIVYQNIETYMQEQLDLGFRIPGSPGSFAFQSWIVDQIDSKPSWNIQIQNHTYREIVLRNYWITSLDQTAFPSIIIGAHYDSRANATEEDVTKQVPGANDAASGVAAILELIDHIPAQLASEVGFVLFDGEDQGGLTITSGQPSWNWAVGSVFFVNALTSDQIANTDAFILFDMIANDELIMKKEGNSNTVLLNEFWLVAGDLGYGDIFIDERGVSLLDDHLAFKQVGIDVIDLIDFSYPEWHTTLDDMDHVSAENAAIVVDVTYSWFLDHFNYIETSITTTTNATTTNSTFNDIQNASNERETPFYLILEPIFMVFVLRKISKNKKR